MAGEFLQTAVDKGLEGLKRYPTMFYFATESEAANLLLRWNDKIDFHSLGFLLTRFNDPVALVYCKEYEPYGPILVVGQNNHRLNENKKLILPYLDSMQKRK